MSHITVPDILVTHASANQFLLNTRYHQLARNTIDYWMTPKTTLFDRDKLLTTISAASLSPLTTLSLYIHVPFCAQKCTFCAFSGGNSLHFKEAERYAKLVVIQLKDLLYRTQASYLPIRSVNIGGGSPCLLREHIEEILHAVTTLPGYHSQTELSCEMALATTSKVFLEKLAQYRVQKISFGLQTLHPEIRKHLRLPSNYTMHLERFLDMVRGRFPIINADLMTCLPGQTLEMAMEDLQTLMQHPDINSISSYLLTDGAAPALVSSILSGSVPHQARPRDQAYMRLQTYATFLKQGWIRRGTNTYMNPAKIPSTVLACMGGNECIGTRRYEDFLIGAGPQAVSCMPGVRVENTVDLNKWITDVEQGHQSFFLPKCSLIHQRDTALWIFPLRWEGLTHRDYNNMLAHDALSKHQIETLQRMIVEGLVYETSAGYELTILGEIFMGHIVRDLKKSEFQQVLDDYIAEGYSIGELIARGKERDTHLANNRQCVSHNTPDHSLNEGAR